MIPLIVVLLGSPPLAPGIADQVSRLGGHHVTIAADQASFTIEDVAGEGAPRVGVIERRGKQLWLKAEGGQALRLTGPLATARIAGPGYRVWVLGELESDDALRARRLGVLARPAAATRYGK